MGIYHDEAILPPPEGTNQTPVRGSDHRARHISPDWLVLSLVPAPLIITDLDWAIPLARTEWNGLTAHRTRFPLVNVEALRLQVQVTKAGKGWIGVQVSGDNGATWNSIDGANMVQINTNYAGVKDSGWVKLSATARAMADALVRLIGEQGDGAAATQFGMVTLHAR